MIFKVSNAALVVFCFFSFQSARSAVVYSPVDYNPPLGGKGFSVTGIMTSSTLGDFTESEATAGGIIEDWDLTVTVGASETYRFLPENSEWIYESTLDIAAMITITETKIVLKELFLDGFFSASTSLYLVSSDLDKRISYLNLPSSSFIMEFSDMDFNNSLSFIGGGGDSTIAFQAIPEPSSLLLIGAGGVAFTKRRRRPNLVK
jgi:hypothetical protein